MAGVGADARAGGAGPGRGQHHRRGAPAGAARPARALAVRDLLRQPGHPQLRGPRRGQRAVPSALRRAGRDGDVGRRRSTRCRGSSSRSSLFVARVRGVRRHPVGLDRPVRQRRVSVTIVSSGSSASWSSPARRGARAAVARRRSSRPAPGRDALRVLRPGQAAAAVRGNLLTQVLFAVAFGVCARPSACSLRFAVPDPDQHRRVAVRRADPRAGWHRRHGGRPDASASPPSACPRRPRSRSPSLTGSPASTCRRSGAWFCYRRLIQRRFCSAGPATAPPASPSPAAARCRR